jgi:hypothetical protein
VKRLLTAVVTAALVIGLAGPAAAADWSTGGNGGGSGGKDPGSSNPSPRPGGGSGADAGGTSGQWSDAGIVWGNPASKTARAPFPRASGSKAKALRCSGSNKWGKYLGLRWSAWGHTTSNGSEGVGSYRYYYLDGAAGSCVDAPHYVIETKRCITRVSGDVTWAFRRTDGKPVTIKDLGTSYTAFERSGHNDLSKCSSTFTKGFSFDDVVWGQYKGRAFAYERIMTIRRYVTPHARTGKIPPSVVLSVSGERKVNPVTVWWTQTCAKGVEMGKKDDRDFTANGCKPKGSTSEWRCGLPSTAYPFVAGVRNSSVIDVFHDAKRQPLEWRTLPKPTGDLRAIKGKRVRLDYVKGSPFRQGAALNAANQHFLTIPAMGSWRPGWEADGPAGKTRYVGQFFKAGLPGQNLVLRPLYAFAAEFKHQYAVVSGIRSDGSLVFTTKTRWAGSTASCPGVPTNLAIQRARISN